jgi:hypothetical protein
MTPADQAIARAMQTQDPADIRQAAELLENERRFPEALEFYWWQVHAAPDDPAARSALECCQSLWSAVQRGQKLAARVRPLLREPHLLDDVLPQLEHDPELCALVAETVMEWLRVGENLPPDTPDAVTLRLAATRRSKYTPWFEASASLWRWCHELTGDEEAEQAAEYVELLISGYELHRRRSGGSARVNKVLWPLRFALHRRASRAEVEKAMRVAMRLLEDAGEGPNDDGSPGLGVPRRPSPPRLPGEARQKPPTA